LPAPPLPLKPAVGTPLAEHNHQKKGKVIMQKYKFIRQISLVLFILLSACTNGRSPNVTLTELSSNVISYDDIVRINNCGGKADSEQTQSRSFATTFEGGAELSVGYEAIAEGSISAKYSQYRNITKSQRLIAPPKTNMEFVIRWSEEVRAGNVTVDGSTGNYEVRIPISVEQISSQDLGNCPQNSGLNPNVQPTPVINPEPVQQQPSGDCQESGGAGLSSLPSSPSSGCVLIIEWTMPNDTKNCGIVLASAKPIVPNNAIGTWWNVYPTRPESHVQEFSQKYPHCKVDDQR
jgi:hypothetical protein